MDQLIWHETITSMIFFFLKDMQTKETNSKWQFFYGIFDYGNKTKRKLTRISKLSASNMNQTHLSFYFSWFIRTPRTKYAETKT